MRLRLQNTVAAHAATLPTACVVATLLWWLPQGGYSSAYLAGWLVCACVSCVLFVMVSDNELLRVRSRMVTALYVLLLSVCGFMHPLSVGAVSSLLLALSVYSLLRTYESRVSVVDTFHASVLLSIGSLLWAPLLLLAPVLLLCQGVLLRSLSWRVAGAWLVGVLLPYWFWFAGAYVIGDPSAPLHHVALVVSPFCEGFYWEWAVAQARMLDWHGFRSAFSSALVHRLVSHPSESVSLGFVLLLALTGDVHYLRSSFDDKTRVRVCHQCILVFQVSLLVWLVLQPTAYYVLFPLLVLVVVPSSAHFFALTHTWFTNVWFLLCVCALVAVGVCCLHPLWNPPVPVSSCFMSVPLSFI